MIFRFDSLGCHLQRTTNYSKKKVERWNFEQEEGKINSDEAFFFLFKEAKFNTVGETIFRNCLDPGTVSNLEFHHSAERGRELKNSN